MDIDEMSDFATRASSLDAAIKINGPSVTVRWALRDAEDIYLWLKDGKLPMTLEEAVAGIVKEVTS